MLRCAGRLALGLLLATLPLVASKAGTDSSRASFPCDNVGSLTRVERAVCGHPSLAALDMQLAYAFAAALEDSLRPLRVDALEAEWLRDVRNACRTVECLDFGYRERINELRSRTDRPPVQRDLWASGPGRSPAGAILRKRLSALAHRCLDDVVTIDLGDGARRSAAAFDCQRGNDNSGFYVFHAERGSFRLVLSGITDNINVLDERARGLRMLRIWGHASGADSGVTIAAFNGHRYRALVCFDLLVHQGEALPRAEREDCRNGLLDP